MSGRWWLVDGEIIVIPFFFLSVYRPHSMTLLLPSESCHLFSSPPSLECHMPALHRIGHFDCAIACPNRACDGDQPIHQRFNTIIKIRVLFLQLLSAINASCPTQWINVLRCICYNHMKDRASRSHKPTSAKWHLARNRLLSFTSMSFASCTCMLRHLDCVIFCANRVCGDHQPMYESLKATLALIFWHLFLLRISSHVGY